VAEGAPDHRSRRLNKRSIERVSEATEPVERDPVERDPAAYPFSVDIPTRWRDNDAYGHLNNALYFTFFETAVMRCLQGEDDQAPVLDGVRCFTVENGCRYHAPLRHPDTLRCAIRVARLGRSSVRYELALFGAADPGAAAATGFVIDVFVDAVGERPVAIPEPARSRLARWSRP